jgi:hypothetical protein
MKLRYLALEHIANKWTVPVQTGRLPCRRNRKKNFRSAKTPKIYRFRARIPEPRGELPLAILESRTLSWRSGCVFAEPYPALRSVQLPGMKNYKTCGCLHKCT